MKDHTTLFKEVFGESSDSDDDELQQQQPQPQPQRCLFDASSILKRGSSSLHETNPSWERSNEINGLWLCRDFLSLHNQSSLLFAIENEGWFTEAFHNQAMRFGDLPRWAKELSNFIREEVLSSNYVPEPMPLDLLWREPLFDQLIANVYQPGEGICAHIDLMRFEDGIGIVSLESSCVMHFTHVEEEVNNKEKDGKKIPPATKIPIYLTPGSLVLMSGEARYLWKHEINRNPGFQIWEGQEMDQKRRTSITLRKLCQV